MTTTVRRAAAFAAVGVLALVVPWVGQLEDPAFETVAAVGPFLLVAAAALTIDDGSTLFALFARPGDRQDGKLYALAGFSLSAAGLAILAVGFGMPVPVYVGTVFLLAVGNLGGHVVRLWRDDPLPATAGFVVAAFLAGVVGQLAAARLARMPDTLPVVVFLAASGALLAALIREALFQRDDPLVMISVALLLWLFASLPIEVTATRIVVALGVIAVLGFLSYLLQTASLPGILTGVLLSLLTIVVGDYGWFAMLVAFFGIGGLSTKYGYEIKAERGIAEENQGARGTGNVLANSLVALLAVLAAAAGPHLELPATAFRFAFAGSLAAALSDTLSSEIGGLFDDPRLVTSLEVVEPGTDGAVTWQGELAGLAGAAIVAGIAALAFEGVATVGAGVIVAAGVAGMTVDSLLGATVEGWLFGNQGVNLLATLAAAVVGAGLAVSVGLVAV
ncbi:MAG: TIGR00297 family protein [Salinirussus sp.]